MGSWKSLTGVRVPAADSHSPQRHSLHPAHAPVPAPRVGVCKPHARCITQRWTHAIKQAHHPQQCISAVLFSGCACVRGASHRLWQEAANGMQAVAVRPYISCRHTGAATTAAQAGGRVMTAQRSRLSVCHSTHTLTHTRTHLSPTSSPARHSTAHARLTRPNTDNKTGTPPTPASLGVRTRQAACIYSHAFRPIYTQTQMSADATK